MYELGGMCGTVRKSAVDMFILLYERNVSEFLTAVFLTSHYINVVNESE